MKTPFYYKYGTQYFAVISKTESINVDFEDDGASVSLIVNTSYYDFYLHSKDNKKPYHKAILVSQLDFTIKMKEAEQIIYNKLNG